MAPIRCGVWNCGRRPVETLVYCNPLAIGKGFLRVCAGHLAVHVAEHFLKEKP